MRTSTVILTKSSNEFKTAPRELLQKPMTTTQLNSLKVCLNWKPLDNCPRCLPLNFTHSNFNDKAGRNEPDFLPPPHSISGSIDHANKIREYNCKKNFFKVLVFLPDNQEPNYVALLISNTSFSDEVSYVFWTLGQMCSPLPHTHINCNASECLEVSEINN